LVGYNIIKGETMKRIIGFAIAIIFLASCAAQHQTGEQYGSLADSGLRNLQKFWQRSVVTAFAS